MDKSKRNSMGQNNKSRLQLAVGFQILIALVLMGRFFQVQIVARHHYAGLGESQSIRQISLSPMRGQIYDRNGTALALNTEIDSTNLQALSSLVVAEGGAPVKRIVRRLYPMGSLGGQMLGFVGRDGYGLSGIEYGYDNFLYGEAGWSVTRQDAKSRRVFELDLPVKEPVDGLSVRLTIDVHLQEILESCLQEGITKTKSVAGAVIVMDPYTGDILGMASYPFVDPNGFSRQNMDNYRNNALAMVYEPGSTFKLVTASAALEEGTFRESDLIETGNGELEIYGETIHDTHKHGTITFKQAIAFSSNVAFAKMAIALGDATLYRYIRNFGFGQRSGIGLPGEESGILRPIEKWSGRTLVTLAMGQELAVTLLQMGTAYCAIANGGILMTPRVVTGFYENGVLKEAVDVKPIRRVISPRTARRLTDCLTSVVEGDSGTGIEARVEGILIAGKTGTAQKIDAKTHQYMRDKYVASFAGYFPAENPSLMCMVILDEPEGTYYGGLTAAPIFRECAVRILHSQDMPYGARIMGNIKPASQAGLQVTAPNLKTLRVDSAIQVCDRMGLRLVVDGRGTRIEKQSVKAGKPLLRGDSLVVKTDEGFRRVSDIVPDVTGLSTREAVARLLFKGIPVRVEGSGTVRKQSPAPGQPLTGRAACVIEAG